LTAYNYAFGTPHNLLGPIPFLRHNHFGFFVGGPILKAVIWSLLTRYSTGMSIYDQSYTLGWGSALYQGRL